MARKNRSNRTPELGLPKLKGFTQQVEAAPDPTQPPPSPTVAPDSPAVPADESHGATQQPARKSAWPPSKPPPPPSSGGQQPRPVRKPHGTGGSDPGNRGKRGPSSKPNYSGERDPTICHWGAGRGQEGCKNPPNPGGVAFCEEHHQALIRQRLERGWRGA
jgi:hypothetical protein